MTTYAKRKLKFSWNENFNLLHYVEWDRIVTLNVAQAEWGEASAREIATCKQNVGQKEDFMHSNFQMDISLPWIDAAFT
jgi:hypothetical protein